MNNFSLLAADKVVMLAFACVTLVVGFGLVHNALAQQSTSRFTHPPWPIFACSYAGHLAIPRLSGRLVPFRERSLERKVRAGTSSSAS